jgi:hypothetical protein
VLQSIAPLDAVPGRLRSAVARLLRDWGYGWPDVSFAGTVEVPAGEHWPLAPGAVEIWVFAIAAGRLAVGDELESAGGRAAGLGVSAFSGGVIPVTPYQAWVYEFLGRRGGGRSPEWAAPPMVPTTPDMEPQSRVSKLAKFQEASSAVRLAGVTRYMYATINQAAPSR